VTLRLRLGLVILVTAVPLVGVLMWLRRDADRRAIEDGMRRYVTQLMENERWECELDPTTYGGDLADMHRSRRGRFRPRRPGPPPPVGPGGGPPDGMGPPRRRGPPPRPPGVPRHWLWAYRADLHSDNPTAPVLPPHLADPVRAGADLAGGTVRVDGRDGYEILVRTPWQDGPCACFLLRSVGGRVPSSAHQQLWASIVLCGVLLLAVLFAAGPMLRRIRRLTADVRRSAETRYETPVPVAGRDEITDLARAFNEAGGELRAHLETIEQREQTLRRFVRNTTHDVMIPLTVLQGDLADLRRSLEGGEPPDRAKVVQALEEAHYMGSLLHNLSAAAKLEGGEHQLQMHPVDLNALVERAVLRHLPMARLRHIELEYGVPEPILHTRGDLTLIEQAVSNVIQNAVRYNEEGGHVAVILEAPRDRPGTFSIQVVDDGPGIAPQDMARLAERRFRGEEARTRHPDGSGLGLHITRDVAERHGFRLVFRPSEYGGLAVELSGRLLAGAEGGG
jgi:signal transduction histidine kinase